jgi:hypothetical protein
MYDKISSCIRNLDHESQHIRIKAINELGEIGDELCLKELRERLKIMTMEHKALVIAVAKLKKKFGIV